MHYALRFLSISAFLITLLAGCSYLTGKTAGQNLDDATITASVKTKLATDQSASTLTRIDVDTNKGTVTLNGVVDDAATKKRVAELAKQVGGVQNVVNNLQVQTSK